MKVNVGRNLQSVQARHKVLYIPTTYQGIATLQERENLVARLEVPIDIPFEHMVLISFLKSYPSSCDTAILAIPSL